MNVTFFRLKGQTIMLEEKMKNGILGKLFFFTLIYLAMLWFGAKREQKNGADFYDSRQIEGKMALRHW